MAKSNGFHEFFKVDCRKITDFLFNASLPNSSIVEKIAIIQAKSSNNGKTYFFAYSTLLFLFDGLNSYEVCGAGHLQWHPRAENNAVSAFNKARLFGRVRSLLHKLVPVVPSIV